MTEGFPEGFTDLITVTGDFFKNPVPRNPKARKRICPRLEQTAFHESGHALVYFLLGIAVTSVTIIPVMDCRGLCYISYPPEKNVSPAAWEFFLYQDIVATLAGPLAAQERVGGIYLKARDAGVDQGDESDAEDVQASLAQLMPKASSLERQLMLNHLGRITQSLITDPVVWTAIEAVADALLQENTLTGKRLEEVLRPVLSEAGRERLRRLTNRKIRAIQKRAEQLAEQWAEEAAASAYLLRPEKIARNPLLD